MFARIKKSGRYQYLQIVENRREGSKVRQRVVATLGRMDRLGAKRDVETLIRSLARYSERVLLVLSGKRDVYAHSKKDWSGADFPTAMGAVGDQTHPGGAFVGSEVFV